MKSSVLPILLGSLLAGTVPAAAQWTNNPRADLILGNRQTPENSLGMVNGLAVDPVNRKIYVSCQQTNRVMRFNLKAAAAGGDPLVRVEAVFGQPDTCTVSAGNGPAKFNMPGAIAVDGQGRLWVADRSNRRVLRFDDAYAKATGAPADGVLGQPDLNSNSSAQFTAGINGLAADFSGNLYVTESLYHSVFRYNQAAQKPMGGAPDVVFGQPDMATKTSGLSAAKFTQPWGIAVQSGPGGTTLWVTDRGNNRLLRFDQAQAAASGVSASAVLGQPDMVTNSAGNAMSRFKNPEQVLAFSNNVYVYDTGNTRTLVFPGNTPPLNASAVAQLRQTENLVSPVTCMAGDPAYGRLWGGGNATVSWFDTGGSGSGGSIILRDGYFGSLLSKVRTAHDVAVDPVSGKVFVADGTYNGSGAVYRYSNYNALVNGEEPEAAVCRIQSAATASVGNGLFVPYGLCLDLQGRLWVADATTSAVYRYDNAATMAAYTPHTAKLGGATGTAANQMKSPQDVYADAQGRVWVADTNNHRVLRFDNAASKPDGAAANAVLGQAGFGTAAAGSPATFSNLYLPRGLTGDGSGNLWVADSGNHRVLRYANAASKPNGGAANTVFGQPNGTTAVGSLGQTGLDAPAGLAMDGMHLWVSEAGNKRVVRYPYAALLSNGAPADTVVGQPDFQRNDTVVDHYHVTTPLGIAVDPSGRLYVADTEADRVMRYSPVSLVVLNQGLTAQNRFFLTWRSSAGALYDIESSEDLQLWSYETTQPGDASSTSWVAPLPASGRRFYRVVMK